MKPNVIQDFIGRNWLHASMQEDQTIYGLADYRSHNICYVGHAGDVQKRYRDHISRRYQEGAGIEKGLWIDELLEQGLAPALIILEYCKSAIVSERERRWMFHFFQQRAPLLNMEATMTHMVAAIQSYTCDFLTLPVDAPEWIHIYTAYLHDRDERRRQ